MDPQNDRQKNGGKEDPNHRNQRRAHQKPNRENSTNGRIGYTSQQKNQNQTNDGKSNTNIERKVRNELDQKSRQYVRSDYKSNRSKRTDRMMNYKRLEELIAKYSANITDLLLNLKCDKSFLNLISNDDKLKGKFGDYKFLCNVLQALALISDCDNRVLIPYFEEMNEHKFEDPIVRYLHHLTNSFYSLDNRNIELYKSAFKNLIKFVGTYQILLQKASTNKVSNIIQQMKQVVKIDRKGTFINQNLVQLFEVIVCRNDSIIASIDDSHESHSFTESLEDKNHFRKVSIFPTTEEINSFERSFIRPNIVEGKYDSTDQYLETQFKLLREDFVRPLREGIAEYNERLRQNKPIKRLNDIRIYTNVNITGSEFRNGLIHSASFNIKDYKHVHWQNSKQLIYGSMLCLTSNNFKTFCFATVAGKRDPNLLSKGIFQMKFEAQDMDEEMIEFTSNTLIMAESNAYFEAYRHNLLALQQFKSHEFPLKDYIINVSTDIKFLTHLNRNTIYDLSDLALSLDKIDSEKMLSIMESLNSGDYYNKSLTFLDKIKPQSKDIRTSIRQTRLQNVFIMNDQLWPKSSYLGVDDSQFEAIKAALTKQLVVIQGPPGTGKTYVGLRIVQILLRNKHLWNTRQGSSPILVVCYTNHALDQFLEGMVPFCRIKNGIVRIGGRCKSEILDRYTLSNLKRQMKEKRTVPKHIFMSLKDTRSELIDIQTELSSVQKGVQKSRTTILGNKLKTTIEKMRPTYKMQNFIDQFKSYDHNFKSALIKWLTAKLVLKKVWVDIKESNKNLLKLNQIIELFSNNMMNKEEVMRISDVTQLQHSDRWRLYRFWRQLYIRSKQSQLNELNDKFDEKIKYLKNLKTSSAEDNGALLRYYILVCEEKLKDIEKEINSVESQIIDCRKKLLGYQLKVTIDEYDIDSNEKKTEQLIETYNKNFDLAISEWLTNKVIVKDVFVETERSQDLYYNDPIDDEIEDTDSIISHDSEIEDLLEVDEEEVQNILDSRIMEDENDCESIAEQNNRIGLSALKKKHKKRLQNEMKQELSSNDIMSLIEVIKITDISKLSTKDRWRLYRFWRRKYCQEREILIKELNKRYAEKQKQFERIRLEEDLYVIRDCDIIGLTTTGAAKFRTIIEQIDPFIVVIEEAAEVLESHVVTALTQSTKHLILIGDHQQLKPNPTVYDLAKNYNLDVSLFERMIRNGLPYYQLKVQHRMRPSISSLLVPHIYKELMDHESVQRYDDIRGVSKSMFFINHNHRESVPTNDSTSKKNEFEAEFIVRFCKYLILQEYRPTQITILTMYSAQLFQIKQLMKRQDILNGVRATVLDNYQGEECDIILLSFVRSNINGGIGFLNIPNRVNVALSRARMGMYCIGNFDCLSVQSKLWNDIKKCLIKTEEIGSKLELFCPNHPRNKTIITKASDFDNVPEGGCLERCMQSLKCDHKCPLVCHAYDKEHKTIVCKEKCPLFACESQHRCAYKCHFPDKCKPCSVLVTKTIPSCGHQILIRCSSDPLKAFCTKPCDKNLICGHRCSQVCGNVCTKICRFLVTIDSKCGHRVEVECGQQSHSETVLENCKEECNTLLKCSHICKGSCGTCHQKRLHIFCNEKCGRTLTCGHVCKALCGQSCKCKDKCHTKTFRTSDQNLKTLIKMNEKIEGLSDKLKSIRSNSSTNFMSVILRKINKLKTEVNKRDLTQSQLFVLSKKFEIIEQISVFKQQLLEWNDIQDSKQDLTLINEFTHSLNIRIDKLLNFIDINYCDINNYQQSSDTRNELNRYLSMSEALKLIIENDFEERGKLFLIKAFKLLLDINPLTDYRLQEINALVNCAKKYILKQLEFISDLSPYAYIIKTYFNNSKAHANIDVSLKSIQRYNDSEFSLKFNKSYSSDNRMLLWHGTRNTNLESIFKEGLKLPSHGGMFGKGIYFADRVTKSVQYTDCRRSGRTGTLLLCEVAVGNIFVTTTPNHNLSLPDGYQSVRGPGKQTRDPSDECLIDNNLLVPWGSTIPNPNVIPIPPLEYDEYVIYDPKRALIRFIVEIERH